MFARSVGLNVANIATLAIPNARHATWCESRQEPLGRYRARSVHQPWDSRMEKPLAVAVVALSFASSCVLAQSQERAGDAALGALSEAVVLGPVGAVAGAVIGFTAGPAISHSRATRGPQPQGHQNLPKRSASPVSGGAPAQSASRPAPAPQPAATEKPVPATSVGTEARKFYAACANLGVKGPTESQAGVKPTPPRPVTRSRPDPRRSALFHPLVM